MTFSTGCYTPGTAAIVIDAAATITDADSANFAGGSLTVDFSDFTQTTDRLAIRSIGTGVGQINLNGSAVRYGTTIIGTYSGGFVNNSALVITLGSAATPTTVQALLRQITFSNGDPTASALPRTIRFVADDGLDGIGEAAFRTVTIAELALVPVITLSNGPTEYPGDQIAVIVDDGASVADEDSTDFAGGSLTVSFASGQSTADRLGIFNRGTGFDEINLVGNTVRWGVTAIGTYSGGFTSNAPLVIALNSNADPETVGTLIRHLTFNVESATPTTTDRIIHFVLYDGNNGTSQAAAKTVVVGSGANPGPTVQLSSGSPTFSKLGPAVAIDNQITVTSPNLGGGVLTISINDVNTGKKKFDVFSTSSLSGIGTSRGTQLVAGRWVTVIDLDSNATAQMVQNALRAVTFTTSGRGLKFTTRNVKIQIEDADGDTSQAVTKTINVSKKRIKPPRN